MAAVHSRATRRSQNATIARAIAILDERLRKPGAALNTPRRAREYVRLHIGEEGCEIFVALWLDAQNRLIELERISVGTLTQTSVFPREVVKSALRLNAGAVIFAHNHPSGVAEPSRADEILTRGLKIALELVDVRVHDHLVIAGAQSFSFADCGLL